MVTAEELKDLEYLPGEIANVDRTVKSLQRLPYLTDMGACQKAECAAALTELIQTYQKRREMCAGQLARLRAFLDSIQDGFLRDLFRLRYEDGKEWLQVWDIIADRGFYYEPDSLRQMCKRYIEGYNRNEAENEKNNRATAAV